MEKEGRGGREGRGRQKGAGKGAEVYSHAYLEQGRRLAKADPGTYPSSA